MFGHDSEPTRIFKYGAFVPTENLEIVREQLRLCGRYKNKLVELELARRAATEAALRIHFPRLAELDGLIEGAETEIEAIRERTKAGNARDRKRNRMPPADKARIAELKAGLRPLWDERKALRADAFGPENVKALRKAIKDAKKRKEDTAGLQRDLNAAVSAWHARVPQSLALKDTLAETEAKHKAGWHEAREASGLFWPNKAICEQDMSDLRSGPPPRYRRFQGEGRIAVQIQTKRDGDSNPVTMRPADLYAGRNPMLRMIGEGRMRECWLRVGSSGKGREPVWAKFPVILHRDLPADSKIKWAYLVCKKIASHERWSLCLTLARAGGWGREDLAPAGTVGVDVGWRLTDAGLRVAYWVGDDEQRGELVLPMRWVERIRWVAELKSQRDTALNVLRPQFKEWLDSKPAEMFPDWFAETIQYMGQWKSAGRFAGLAVRWRGERFVGDEDGYALLNAWRKADKRLWEEERNLHDKLQAQRADIYRVFARDMARRYRAIRLEKFDLRKVAETPKAEVDDPKAQARVNRFIADISKLRGCIVQTGAQIEWREAADTTKRCDNCGHVHDFDRIELAVACPECGHVRDQDERAGRNLLAQAPA